MTQPAPGPDQTPLAKVVFNLEPPPSINHIWQRGSRGKVFRSRNYLTWLRISHLMVGRPGSFAGPVAIRLWMIGGKGWRRGRDIDNVLKPILDFLVHAGLIPDDNHDIVQRITITYSDPPKAKDKAFLRVRIHGIKGPADATQP